MEKKKNKIGKWNIKRENKMLEHENVWSNGNPGKSIDTMLVFI